MAGPRSRLAAIGHSQSRARRRRRCPSGCEGRARRARGKNPSFARGGGLLDLSPASVLAEADPRASTPPFKQE